MYSISVHRIKAVLSVNSGLFTVAYTVRAYGIVHSECLSISGTIPHRLAGERVSENVVMRLVDLYVGKGRNVNTDNLVIGEQVA